MPSVKKRGGLGRGLNALVSEAEYETGGSATSAANTASEVKLPIEDIVPNPNPRTRRFAAAFGSQAWKRL